MAKRKNKYTVQYLEQWDTRFGASERIVVRDENGKFINNFSITALKKAPFAPKSRQR